MKLRNKKTGKIAVCSPIKVYGDETEDVYESVMRFHDEWEDYDPLIKDEKIRKAVKAWSEASGIDPNNIKISIGSRCTSFIGWIEGKTGGFSIDFQSSSKLGQFIDGAKTTIEELCGEDK